MKLWKIQRRELCHSIFCTKRLKHTLITQGIDTSKEGTINKIFGFFSIYCRTAAISPKWHGVFTLPNREDKAMSTCVISTSSVVFNKCVYRRPSALSYTSLVCDPPKDFPCDALSLLTDGSSSHGQYFKKLLKERNDNFNIPFLKR